MAAPRLVGCQDGLRIERRMATNRRPGTSGSARAATCRLSICSCLQFADLDCVAQVFAL